LRDESISIRVKGILIILFFSAIFSAGCLQIPSAPNQSMDNQIEVNTSHQIPTDLPTPTETPSPVPTIPRSNVSNWNPYNVLPTPTPVLNHPSILKNDTPNYRKILNTSYSGSVGLAGNAFGKDLNITTGPFSITYTVHPNISSPLNVWVKLTVFDPWQNIIAVGGYNRGYPNQETQTMTLYREGRYYLTIEGDFASIDYTVKTGDLSPTVIPTQVSHEISEEEMMMMQMGGG